MTPPDEELRQADALYRCRFGSTYRDSVCRWAAERSAAPCTRKPNAPTPSPGRGAPASPWRPCATRFSLYRSGGFEALYRRGVLARFRGQPRRLGGEVWSSCSYRSWSSKPGLSIKLP